MSPRSLVSVVLLVVLSLLALRSIAKLLDNPTAFPPHDFVEYWCSGTLNLAGRDPYDPAAMYALEQEIGWDIGQAVMMWNPPWTLTVAMPLAELPWRTAQLVWFAVRIAALCLSAHLLATTYRRPRAAWAITFTWLPCYIALQYGQIPPLMLLGVASFVYLEQRGHRFAAGFACVLLAVKPHLAILFWLAVGLHAIRNREWRIAAGGLVGGLVFSAWPLVQNPQIFAQYFASARTNPPTQWMSPTLGTLLRAIFGVEQFWLQFLPMLPGLVWLAWHWTRSRRTWNWTEQTPGLILVSFVTAPYGAWPYDLTLLVLPFVAVAAARGPTVPLVVFYALLNAGMLVCVGLGLPAHWAVWVAPVALGGGLYLTTRRNEAA